MQKYDMKREVNMKVRNTVHFKFTDGVGIVAHRENPEYLRIIGEWFCREVEAMPLSQPTDTPHNCPMCKMMKIVDNSAY